MFSPGCIRTGGVVETVIMMIEVNRIVLLLVPSLFVLYISPFFSLYSESRISACIDD